MLKAREVLRLKHEVQLSFREIGQACNCGKTTVAEILERAEKAGITWPIELRYHCFITDPKQTLFTRTR